MLADVVRGCLDPGLSDDCSQDERVLAGETDLQSTRQRKSEEGSLDERVHRHNKHGIVAGM